MPIILLLMSLLRFQRPYFSRCSTRYVHATPWIAPVYSEHVPCKAATLISGQLLTLTVLASDSGLCLRDVSPGPAADDSHLAGCRWVAL